jgi:gustatory receptor
MKRVGQQIFYMVPMVLQIFLPCYFANEVSIAAEKLSMSVLHCKWYYGNTKFRNSLKIFIINASQPVIIYAGIFFEVTLKNFVDFCNITYKFYTLLKNMSIT